MNPDHDRSNLDEVLRIEGGQVLATLIRLLGDIDRAEDALQDAMVAASTHGPGTAFPTSPPRG